MAIDTVARALSEEIQTDLTRTKDPTLPGTVTVNSAFTARSCITTRKNAKKEVKITKDNFTGLKFITLKQAVLNPKILIPIMELVWFFNQELHDPPHECSPCHSAADFKFVYHFHCNVQ
jgi:hypothetical protein